MNRRDRRKASKGKKKSEIMSFDQFKQALLKRGFKIRVDENGVEVVEGLRLKTEKEIEFERTPKSPDDPLH